MNEVLPNIPVVGGLYQQRRPPSSSPLMTIMIVEVSDDVSSRSWQYSYLMAGKVWEGRMAKERWPEMMKRVK